jgi:YgiT-type zinc finger domain-containing protein
MNLSTVVEIEMEIDEPRAAQCANCGSTNIRMVEVRSAFWHDERLVIVNDIPALVCDACHEHFYDDRTAVMLDLLRGDGYPAEQAKTEVLVPVFSLRDRISTRSAG